MAMGSRGVAGSVDEYMTTVPPQSREAVEELRRLVREAVPEATEIISYGIPTFDLAGQHLVHFAGYEKHVGLYPTPSAVQTFKDELKPYKTTRGSVQFSLDQPLPVDLVRRMVEFRVQEVGAGDARR